MGDNVFFLWSSVEDFSSAEVKLSYLVVYECKKHSNRRWLGLPNWCDSKKLAC